MSLERTPPRASAVNNDADSVNICSICNENLLEDQNCLIIQECNHIFHKICIETFLATSSQCPICKRSCQLSELRAYNLNLISNQASVFDSPIQINPPNIPTAKPNGRGKPRGAKAYNTRSYTRNLYNEGPASLNVTQEINSTENEYRPRNSADQSSVRNNFPPNQRNNKPNVDYEYINRMIEENVSRLISSLNITPSLGVNPTINSERPLENPGRNTPTANRNVFYKNDVPIQGQRSVEPGATDQNLNNYSNISTNFRLPYTVDKISAIIQGWNLRFDGSQSGLNVDEFLYRVKSLTLDYFEGDFSLICKNLQILLSGRAREWLWRYRKQVLIIKWEDFCQAFRSQYADFKTSSDLREEIRNRKQKPGENFDVFFDSISCIIDRLDNPMTETEIVETLTRNLRPEIRQELLYINISSVSHLRQLVHKRENFLNDLHVRRNMNNRQDQNPTTRRQLAEIDYDGIAVDYESQIENDAAINAIQASSYQSLCWNCDGKGHHWQDCVQDRQIFCYGCGAKKVYKPNCTKCKYNAVYGSKNHQPSVPPKEQI